MTHPSDAELDRFRGASDSETGRLVREHLDGCEACAGRLAELEREERRTARLLDLLGSEPPRVEAGDVIRRARRRETRRFALAASIAGLLVAGAAAAAVIPGSPLREWLGQARDPRPAVATPEQASDPGPESPPGLAGPGVQFVPEGPVAIEFAPSGEATAVRVAWSESAELTLYAVRGSAAFSIGQAGVNVDDVRPGAAFELRIPRSLSALRVEVDGEPLFVLFDGGVTLPPEIDGRALEAGHTLRFPR